MFGIQTKDVQVKTTPETPPLLRTTRYIFLTPGTTLSTCSTTCEEHTEHDTTCLDAGTTQHVAAGYTRQHKHSPGCPGSLWLL